jgi:acetolactate synthase-1/2/3 large subunit
MNHPAVAETVAECLVRSLVRHGVDVIFGQSLPSAVILAAEKVGIRQLSYRQENAGGAMADGYARVSGKIGVVAAQNGPAATLLVAPLAEALKASIPIVALVQEVERNQSDRNAFQELDHDAVFRSCSKWIRRLNTADRVEDYVDMAFVAAGSGRPGPAVLLLPADLLREPAIHSAHVRRQSHSRWPIDAPRPPATTISAAATLLVEARAPVVMAGGGVLASGAAQALAKLQNIAHLPVFTTNMGKGSVDEFHPLSCGVLGALVGPRALGHHTRPLLERADVILMVGTRTNQNGTDSWRLIPPGAKLIHIDIDPSEIGRNYEAMRLVGDAAQTIDALSDELSGRDLTHRHNTRSGFEKEISAAWAAFALATKETRGSSNAPIRPERVMAELQRLLTPNTTIVADASYSSMWILGELRGLASGMRFLTPRGLAGLGWGLPLAMGAKLARPTDPVVTVVGDGGFAHSWAELETLVRARLGVTVIVLNNGVLGYQKDAETVKFGTYTSACHFSPVDHAAIARACGCRATRIVNSCELATSLVEAISSGEPWLLDVIADPDAHPAISLYDGTLDV